MTISATIAAWLRTPQAVRLPTDWGEAEWQAARWALQVHGVAPLLQATLAPEIVARLPPLLRDYLARQHDLSGQKMAAQLADLDVLLAAYAQAGVAVMPLKGAILARNYYRNPALRPSADLDLLVRDRHAARDVLAGLGYHRLSWNWKHDTYARPEHSGPVVAYDGEHPDNPRSLDLHSRLGMQFWSIRYDMTAAAWAGARLDPSAAAVWHMQPATLLLHLAVHACEDIIARRLRLLQLYDIALVAPQLSSADWEDLLAAADACGEQRLLYAPLAMTARYLGAVPPEVPARLAHSVAPTLRAYLEGATLDMLSLCNSAPTSLAERLRWFRPGSELLGALRHALLPDPGEVTSWFPALSAPHQLPLAYASYALWMLRWSLSRLTGRKRRSLE